MTRLQLIVVASSVLLFGLLYFGFDTKPSDRSVIERTRSLTAENTGIGVLLPDAKATLSADQSALIASLEVSIKESTEDSLKLGLTEDLSSAWYKLGRPDISGHYAEVIAEQLNTETAWSIAGTTYAIGAQRLKEEKNKKFCADRAVKAFENAISLNPENVDNKLNLAVCFADNPPADNPMKGILMLLDLNKKHPDNVPILGTLGRLGLKTGQYAKAVERLEKAITLDPNYKTAICLLVDAYTGLGDAAKAASYAEKCEALN